MSAGKLHNIQLRASQKRHKGNESVGKIPIATPKKIQQEKKTVAEAEQVLAGADMWRAAVCIQRRWRGFRARTRDPIIAEACRTIQSTRMQEYIM